MEMATQYCVRRVATSAILLVKLLKAVNVIWVHMYITITTTKFKFSHTILTAVWPSFDIESEAKNDVRDNIH